jgi:predicted Zn-dependent protease
MHIDEKRESIRNKQKKLEEVLLLYPDFRDGLQQLATTWIQLHRSSEAIRLLLRYQELDARDPVTTYYLAVLYGQREDFKKSWHYLHQVEKLFAADTTLPKVIRTLRQDLMRLCPE